jgi:type VII secretion-associated serine protease mycosin
MDPAAVVGLQRSARGARVVAVFARGGHPVVRVWNESTRSTAVARVAAAQKNPTLVAIETETRQQFLDPVRTTRKANDTLRPQQWALDRLQAESVWTRSRGAGVTVAVIDTGVAAHPDLTGSFVAGKDFASGGNGRNDGHGHGTHVAGIIAATPDNNLGVAGLAPDVTIMPIKVLDDRGSGYSSAVSNGIIWAADRGADIISLSLGGGYDAGQGVAVAYAISRGVTVIAAAGNERGSGSPVSYPAAFPGVIAVSATQSDNLIASYSNRGDYVDIAAPGSAIYSTLPSGYASWSGTSMATPYVSAAAALVMARARALSVTVNVPELLVSTADDLGPVGVDQDFGAGLVDPVGALDALGSGAITLPAPTGVSATASSSSRVDVAWQEPTPTTGVTSYQVTATPGGATCTSAVGTSTCALTGLAASSTYSVSVRSIGSATSSPASTPASVTTLARFDAAGDTFATATAIPGPVIDEYLDVASDIDWWSTTLASAGTLTASISNLPGDYDLRVYNGLNELVAWSINGGQSIDAITYEAAAGRYYLQVSPYGGAFSETQAYRLSVEFAATVVTPPPPPPPPAPAPVDLGGDSQATATDLDPGVVRDYITVNDQDYWTFTLDATYGIALDLSELPADFDIHLLQADGALLASGTRPGAASENLAIQLTAGTYYVRVFGFNGAYSDTQTYALGFAASRVTPPDLGGDTFGAATPMGPGLTADDRIDTDTDVDFWSFNVDALSRADVYLTQLNANFDLALFRMDGSLLARSSKLGNTDELTSAWLVPGTYVLRVRSAARAISNYPYHLEVFARTLGRAVLDQAGESVSTATPLDSTGVYELIHGPSDRDNWSITVTSTSRVVISLSNLPADYDLAILRSDGRLIARSVRSGTGIEEISVRIPAGRYVIRVIARGGAWSEDDYHLMASILPVALTHKRR